ncbi:MAG: hypothetical protein WAZ96_05240 [Candidatus Moraniibacteriota bacterium]
MGRTEKERREREKEGGKEEKEKMIDIFVPIKASFEAFLIFRAYLGIFGVKVASMMAHISQNVAILLDFLANIC